jgi:hypothetical protein
MELRSASQAHDPHVASTKEPAVDSGQARGARVAASSALRVVLPGGGNDRASHDAMLILKRCLVHAAKAF